MGLEIILALAASGVAIAALGLVVYRAVPTKIVTPKVEVEQESVTPPKTVETKISPEPEPVSEAPPPFSEDSPSKSIAAPTDTTTLGASAPFLAIPLPKTARSATRAKRKRRTVRAKPFPADLTTGIPSMDPPDKKEPSAA